MRVAIAVLRAVANLLRARAAASLQPDQLPLEPAKLQARQGEAARLRAVAALLEEEATTMEAGIIPAEALAAEIPVAAPDQVTTAAVTLARGTPATTSPSATPERTPARADLAAAPAARGILTEGEQP